MNPSLIVDKARSYVGTPVGRQGRWGSLDCIGVVLAVAEDLDLRDRSGRKIRREDYRGYPRQPRDGFLEDECRARLVEIPVAEIAAGCVITLRGPLCHAAIVGSVSGSWKPAYLSMIHAHAFGKVAEHIIDDAWRDRITAAFTFPEAMN